jgi:peroxiredoxin Q/BCP
MIAPGHPGSQTELSPKEIASMLVSAFRFKTLKAAALTGSLVAAAIVACLLPLKHVHAAASPAPDLAAVGSAAPNFTLPNQENAPISLADYKGKWVVLYFYPKDQTSGCSLEAHNFQRDLDKYHALHAVVLGVSLDTVESHKTWCTKDSFTFKMLADPTHKVVDLYGVPLMGSGDTHFAQRDTFLISPQGRIVKQWQVHDIQNHSGEVLAAIQSLKK